MRVGQGSQRRRQGEGQQVIAASQQTRSLLLQPPLGLLSVALGTVPVAAGVIAVVLVTTAITFVEMATTNGSTAGDQILHRPALAGHEPMALLIIRSVAAQDVRQLDHGPASES